MKYYSDILNLLFEKEEDLHLAEKRYFDAKKAKEEAKKKKEQEKKTRTIEVEQAFKAAEAAQNGENSANSEVVDMTKKEEKE